MDESTRNSKLLTREAVRQVDRTAIDQLRMSGLVLMENAGRGAVDLLCGLGDLNRVVIYCGKGNNAGDGFVMARHLDLRDIPVEIVLCCEAKDLRGDARANFDLLPHTHAKVRSWHDTKRLNSLEQLDQNDWVVDALLGTGAIGAPRAPFDSAIRAMNRCRARRLAIDISSGLDTDTGQPADPTFQADHTCTFVAAKPGLLAAEARPYVGQVHVVGIGVPRRLLEQFGVARANRAADY